MTTSTAPSVQVVYSAAHVSDLPESLVSNIANANNAGEISITDSNEYLTRPTSTTSIISSGDSSNLTSINEGISLESLTSSSTSATHSITN